MRDWLLAKPSTDPALAANQCNDMKKELKKYLAEIGAKGGKASRRKITPEQQAAMQEARKAKRLSQGTNVSTVAPRTDD